MAAPEEERMHISPTLPTASEARVSSPVVEQSDPIPDQVKLPEPASLPVAIPPSTLSPPPLASSSTSATSATAPAPSASSSAPISLSTTFLNGTTRTWSLSYFLPPSGPSAASVLSSLPESYFAPTPSELQTAFAGQVRQREQLVDRPLLTKALREREEISKSAEREKKWPEIKVRVRFADRSLLEGTLSGKDVLGAVYEMTKAALDEDVRKKPFLLYQTPPKQEFRRADPKFKGKTLLDLGFAPAAVFYFKFEEEADESLNDPTKRPPLLASVLSTGVPLPAPPTFDASQSETGSSKPSEKKLGFGGSSGKVVPSWMKLGGKSGKK
ncbi:hypothetical protein T439DRAFT_323592 [Meredithblackwellia eburnea MCA 4105]